MTPTEQRALLAIALMAAFADGAKADAERDEIKRLSESLGAAAAGLHVGTLVQDVLLKRLTLAQAVADLASVEQRQLAYEVAVCVCDADGKKSSAETAFLASLKRELALGDGGAAAIEAQADALADVIDHPATAVTPAAAVTPTAAAKAPPVPAAPPTTVLSDAEAAELDRAILNRAILCGALELLPQSWASMAIIPLQVRMVYTIGQRYGVQLDQGHVKEFLATVGVGLASQYLEQFGRKLVGGLLGKVAGGLGRGLGRAATGMAFSFATTYALGQLAKRYYGGGRQMSTAVLKDTFQQLLAPARQLQQQYLPQIEQRARTLDATQVMNLVRQPLA